MSDKRPKYGNPDGLTHIDAQGQARTALRESCPISIPTSLLGALSQIPHHAVHEPTIGDDDTGFADGSLRDRRKPR